jgi:hypothetical protein
MYNMGMDHMNMSPTHTSPAGMMNNMNMSPTLTSPTEMMNNMNMSPTLTSPTEMMNNMNMSPTLTSPAGMMDNMNMSPTLTAPAAGKIKGMMDTSLLPTVQHCAATCDQMITHLLHHEDLNHRRHQLEFLRDCVDICHLTASFLARNSYFSKMIANVCAQICEVCGNECAKHPDHHSQHCAQVCLHCAQACRMFAMS